MRTVAILGVSVLIAGCGSGSSPEETLRKVDQAMRSHDRLTFEAYVDVDRLSASVVDEARQGGRIELDDCRGPSDCEAILRETTGRFKDYLLDLADGDAPLDAFFRDVAVQIGRARVVEGNAVADVHFDRKGSGYPDSVTMVTRLERDGDTWKVVGVQNSGLLEELAEDLYYDRIRGGATEDTIPHP